MSRLEQIESYLDGSLAGSAKIDFEQKIQADPELAREVDFQRSLIKGLSEARKLELKARLSAIDISSLATSSSLSITTITTGVLITAALIIGGYYLFRTDVPDTAEVIEKQEPPLSDNSNNTPSEPLPVTEESEKTEPTKNIEEKPGVVTEEKPIGKVESKTVEVEEEDPLDGLVKPEVVDDEFADEVSPLTTDIDVPDPDLEKSISPGREQIEIEMRSKRKYSFHYTFEQSKLILYGDFSDEPYELIEMKKDGSIDLFLYYKSSYYSLDKSETKIVPLEAITSNQIITSLDQLRIK